MSAIIQQETMTVSRSTVLDLVAALQAAGDLTWVDDERLEPEYRADVIAGVAERFRIELLGPMPDEDDEDDEIATDATNVELAARAAEFEAEMIDQCMEKRVSYEQTRGVLEARDGRSAQLREHAKRIRAAGREDVVFPTSKELLENLRLERNAAIEEEGDDAD